MSIGGWLSAAATVASMIGGDKASKAAQKAEKRRAAAIAQANEFAAKQDEQNALLAPAVAQRQGITSDRKADEQIRYLMGAWSKGGPISAGQLALLADMETQKAYNKASLLWEGEDSARKSRMSAAGRRYAGAAGIADAKNNASSYSLSRAANIFSGVSSLASRYGGDIDFGGGSGGTSDPGNDWSGGVSWGGSDSGGGFDW